MEAIEHPPLFAIPGIPDHLTYTWIVMVILIVTGVVASRRLELAPTGLQNFTEMVLEQFLSLLGDVVGHEGRRYLPLIATLGLFILTSNLMGLLPGLMTPTSNLNTTAACALIVFFTYHWIGIKKQGLGGYVRHLGGPVLWLAPLMFVVEVFSHLARPLSLALRLFGNMTGGHILLAVIFSLTLGMVGWATSGSLAAVLIGLPGSALLIVFTTGFLIPLKILVAFLQAFIFCMLSMLYIAGALEEAEPH
jgi:F-type H+-transporting ATPase subunit a